MKDILKIIGIILFTLIGAFIASDIATDTVNKNEQIKILEQSLQDQIQEKQVYINMLEEKEDE